MRRKKNELIVDGGVEKISEWESCVFRVQDFLGSSNVYDAPIKLSTDEPIELSPVKSLDVEYKQDRG